MYFKNWSKENPAVLLIMSNEIKWKCVRYWNWKWNEKVLLILIQLLTVFSLSFSTSTFPSPKWILKRRSRPLVLTARGGQRIASWDIYFIEISASLPYTTGWGHARGLDSAFQQGLTLPKIICSAKNIADQIKLSQDKIALMFYSIS